MSLINKYSTPAERSRGLTFADKFESASKVRENSGVITGATFNNLGVSITGTNKIVYPYYFKHTNTTNLTVIVDVKNLAMLSGVAQLICYGTNAAMAGILWDFAIDSDASTTAKKLLFYGSSIYRSTVTVNANGNHQLAISITTTTATFYMDGQQVGDPVAISFASYIPDKIIVGNAAVGTTPLNGTIRSLKIFKAALTAQEILDDYNNSTYNYENETFLDLPMLTADHDGTAFTTKDRSRNGYVMNLGAAAGSRPTKLTKRGYSFDGGDYIASTTPFNSRTFAALGSGFTYEFIASHNTTLREFLISWQAAGNMTFGFRETTGFLYCVVDGSTAKISTTEIKPYEKAHLVMVVNCVPSTFATTITIYYNGVNVYSVSGGTLNDFTKLILLGGTSSYLTGSIYRARIWQMPLTPIQVQDAYIKSLASINQV